MNNLLIILRPLLMTIIIETIIALIIKIKDKNDLIRIALINVITNSSLTLIIRLSYFILNETYFRLYIYIIILILELIIIIVEAKLFNKYLHKDRNHLSTSFILNIGSFIGGIIWQLLRNYI